MWFEWLESTLERSSAAVEPADARERLQRVEALTNDDAAAEEKASDRAARRTTADALDWVYRPKKRNSAPGLTKRVLSSASRGSHDH